MRSAPPGSGTAGRASAPTCSRAATGASASTTARAFSTSTSTSWRPSSTAAHRPPGSATSAACNAGHRPRPRPATARPRASRTPQLVPQVELGRVDVELEAGRLGRQAALGAQVADALDELLALLIAAARPPADGAVAVDVDAVLEAVALQIARELLPALALGAGALGPLAQHPGDVRRRLEHGALAGLADGELAPHVQLAPREGPLGGLAPVALDPLVGVAAAGDERRLARVQAVELAIGVLDRALARGDALLEPAALAAAAPPEPVELGAQRGDVALGLRALGAGALAVALQPPQLERLGAGEPLDRGLALVDELLQPLGLDGPQRAGTGTSGSRAARSPPSASRIGSSGSATCTSSRATRAPSSTSARATSLASRCSSPSRGSSSRPSGSRASGTSIEGASCSACPSDSASTSSSCWSRSSRIRSSVSRAA